MEALGPSETFVNTSNITRRINPEDLLSKPVIERH